MCFRFIPLLLFMFLVIVLTIIVTGAVVVGALYSAILPFFSIIGNTANYNIAYYGAIGSTERALLSLRYHTAGYQGWGGFSGGQAISGVLADVITGNFGTITQNPNGMKWVITSLTNGSIPAASGGDVERLLQGTGSKEFNMLGYDGLLELPLFIDTALTPAERYVSGTIVNVTATNGVYLQGTLRLPPKVLGGFGALYKLDDATDMDNDHIKDDIVVNRGLKGENSPMNQGFSIIPTIRVDYNQEIPIYDFENAIRESHINNVSDANGTNTPNIFMGDPSSNYEFNMVLQPSIAISHLTGHNAIPANVSIIDSSVGFSTILNDTDLVKKSLTFNLVNKLSSTINQIFPFLEYQVKVCETGVGCNVPVSDRYFRIDASGKIGEYDVHIKLNKPVLKKDGTSDFAIIF